MMNKRVLRKFAIPSSSPNPKNGIFCAHDNTVKNDKTGYVLVDSVEYMPKED